MHTKKALGKKKHKIFFYGYIVILLYLTITPTNDLGTGLFSDYLFEGIDKVVHICMFIPLPLLYYLAYKRSKVEGYLKLILFGLLIEILQYILPTGRSFDWWDWVADIAGVGIGFLILQMLFKLNLIPQKNS